jgi:hypothetical protein
VKRLMVLLSVVCLWAAGSTATQASTLGNASALVGRWQTVRTCQGLMAALTKFHLAPLAPSVVGDYFPNESPAELAKKKSVCTGAKPMLHSHFFARDGKWGSLDQDGNQVDNGSYQVLTANTVKINDGTFRFRVQGRSLLLTPLITAAQKEAALAKPRAFSTAGWMVAVSYWGHRWRRIPCGSRC